MPSKTISSSPLGIRMVTTRRTRSALPAAGGEGRGHTAAGPPTDRQREGSERSLVQP